MLSLVKFTLDLWTSVGDSLAVALTHNPQLCFAGSVYLGVGLLFWLLTPGTGKGFLTLQGVRPGENQFGLTHQHLFIITGKQRLTALELCI